MTMLAVLLQIHPQAKFVRTGNADSNAARLGINPALRQLDTDKEPAYLAGRP